MWWWYYVIRSKDDFDQIIQAWHHYTQVEVDGRILYNLYDDAHIKVNLNLKYYAIYCIFYFDSLTCVLYLQDCGKVWGYGWKFSFYSSMVI